MLLSFVEQQSSLLQKCRPSFRIRELAVSEIQQAGQACKSLDSSSSLSLLLSLAIIIMIIYIL